MNILVTGSLAYDRIMDFPGHFSDHILPEKIHVLNVSFTVNSLTEKFGGTAGNIAYALSLLGEKPIILATIGRDYHRYFEWLTKNNIACDNITIIEEELTGSAYITTDQADNQITGFFVGAMSHAAELSLRESLGERPAICIVAPDDPGAMMRHCKEAREAGVPFIFDPSFQVTAMDGETLTAGSRGALAVMVNDYEFAVFEEKTGKKGDAVFDLVDMAVVTLGGKGSKILLKGAELGIPPAKVDKFVDPTGAGDAYRAGFATGLMRGFELEVCGRLGSVTSAFAVEHNGTQQHRYSKEDFVERYEANFGSLPEGF